MNALLSSFRLIYRLLLTFAVGYLCSYWIALELAHLFQFYLPKAESVFLAALIALVFYLVFVLGLFCIQSLKKLSLYSLTPALLLFALSRCIG